MIRPHVSESVARPLIGRPMTDNPPIRLLQSVGGTLVAARSLSTGAGQDILVEATPLGGRLARFLASLDGGQAPGTQEIGGHTFYVVGHSADLDERITELIEALIALRIVHPTLIQLELALPARRRSLEGAL